MAPTRESTDYYMGEDNPHGLPVSELERIDQTCLEFESSLQRGDLPRIEGYLRSYDDASIARSALLSELLSLEIDYCRRRGLCVGRRDYELRFPAETRAIDAAFHSTTQAGPGERIDAERPLPGERLSITSHYTIQRFHAQGGLGIVYAAVDDSLARPVAIKFPRYRPDCSAGDWRLQREATITGRLEHPGIVSVHAVDSTDERRPCYVMKLVQGVTLRQAVVNMHGERTRQPRSFFQSLAFRQVLQRFIAVCNTVAYAHGRNVIHRDIKPSNIMLGTYGETVLLDWGLAKPLEMKLGGVLGHSATADRPDAKTPVGEPSIGNGSGECGANPKEFVEWNLTSTAPGQLIGTPEFASPEQLAGQLDQVTRQSDIFALGATLYYVLTALAPIRNADPTNKEGVVSARQIQPALPRPLDAICRQAMARLPDDRYQSVEEMTIDLERFLADESVSAASESWIAQWRRSVRKNPAISAAVVVGTLVAVAGSIAASSLLAGKNRALSSVNASLGRINSDLVAARDAEKEAKAQTLTALRTLTDQVIQRLLAQQTVLTDQERKFLDRIKSDYQRFADLQANDPGSAAIRAEGFVRVGQVQRILGQLDEAQASWQKALELASPISDPPPELRRMTSLAHGLYGELLLFLGATDRSRIQLDRAIDHSTSLAKDFPNDARYRLDLAGWHTKLGNLSRTVNDGAAACQAYDASNALLDRLAAEEPQNLEHAWARACNHLLRAAVLTRSGRLAEAENDLALSMDLQQGVIKASPDTARYQYDLSCVHAEWGTLCHQRKQYAAGEEHFKQAIALLDRLVTTYPQMIPNHGGLIESHYRLAKLYQDWDQPDESEEHYRRAIELINKHSEQYAVLPEFQMNWRNVFANFAMHLERRHQFEEAENCYREAIRIAQELAQTYPRLGSRADWGNTLIPLGRLLESQNRTDEAILIFEQAIQSVKVCTDEERSQPKVSAMLQKAHSAAGKLYLGMGELESAAPHWRHLSEVADDAIAIEARAKLAVCLAVSNSVESLAIVDALVGEAPLPTTVTFNLTCACGLIAGAIDDNQQREAIAAKAMGLLHRARNEGYFSEASQIRLLKDSRAFQVLRSRKDFQSFVRELESVESAAK